MKSEKVKKYPRNKSEEFFWLGHRDSEPSPRNARAASCTDKAEVGTLLATCTDLLVPIPQAKKEGSTMCYLLFLCKGYEKDIFCVLQ